MLTAATTAECFSSTPLGSPVVPAAGGGCGAGAWGQGWVGWVRNTGHTGRHGAKQ